MLLRQSREGKGQRVAVVRPDDGGSVRRKPDLVTTKTDNHTDLTYPFNYVPLVYVGTKII